MAQPSQKIPHDGESSTESREILNSLKINSNLILKFNSKTSQKTLNDQIKILQIEGENFNALVEDFKELNFEHFPNIFTVAIEIKNESSEIIEAIKVKVDEKFPKSRSILLQINSKLFFKDKNVKFKIINLNLSEEEIKKNFNDSKLDTKTFLSILNGTKICDWDFEEILKHEKSAQKLLTFAINSQDDFCIRLLKLFDLKFSQAEFFYSVIQSRNFEIFLAFLDVFEESEVKEEKVREFLELKVGEKLQSAFLVAVECRNLKIIEFFLKKAGNFLTFNDLKKSCEIAIEREFFEIFLALKENLLISGENVLKAVEKLHDDIKDGKFDEVKNFAENYPKHRLCYGTRKFCALEFAIECKKFEIFSYLRANNFYTDKGSQLEDKIENLNDNEKHKIRNENLKYVQETPNAFIGLLLSKCKFDALSPISSAIQEMLNDLSKNEVLQSFLKIGSQAELKIIFDFATKSVKSMDPNADEYTMGMIYYQVGLLYVGKDLSKCERYGTFMHELTHLIFFLIYENKCLPYCKGDSERENLWVQVLEEEKLNYEQKKDTTEDIIKWVFQCYDPGYEQKAELAVRVNHIMARYLNEPQRVEDLRSTHKSLFNFFNDFIFPEIRIPNILQTIKLNNDFGLLKKLVESNSELESTSNREFLDETSKKLVITSNIPELALKKLFLDLRNSSTNKLHLKAKNIFINPQNLHLKDELESLLKTSQIERIILDVTDSQSLSNSEKFLKYIDDKIQIFVVCDEKSAEKFTNFKKVRKNFTWSDLKSEMQQKLMNKNLNFQGKYFKVLNFFTTIPDKILPILYSDEEISVNLNKNLTNLANFIPRTIQRKSETFPFVNFMKFSELCRIWLFADIAGSGKTTLLQNFHKELLEKCPQHFVVFIPLREHFKNLSEDFDENFEEKIAIMLNLNEFEREIFIQKFAKGEVKILFDAFDEISPKCKEETLKLFKLFEERKEKNQIWITTRTHLEHDLESELKVESFKIQLLSAENQIDFLCHEWINSHSSKDFIKVCAKQITQKIAEIVKNHPNIIGIPLIVQSVAKLFSHKINGNFSTLIENIKLSEIYEKIVQECLQIFAQRNDKKVHEMVEKQSSLRQVHEYLVIVHFFDEHFANTLGMSLNEDEWPIEEIARCGILTYDVNKKVFFNHETYAEYFLASLMRNIIRNYSIFSSSQVEIFTQIMREEKFQVSKLFLSEMFENFDEMNFKFLRTEKNPETLKFVETFLDFILDLKNISEFEEKLAKLLITISKNSENFEMFFVKTQNFYGENLIEKFLLKLNPDGSINLQQIAENLKKEHLKKILMLKTSKKVTILHKTISNFEQFKNILEIFQKNVDKEFQKKLFRFKNEKGRNILQISIWKNEKSFKLIFEALENLFNKNEFESFLNEVDQDGYNILHLAALDVLSKELFEFLWLKFLKIDENKKEFFMQKGKFDRNILQLSAGNENDPEIFRFVFHLAKSFCKNEKEIKNLILEKNLQFLILEENSRNLNLISFAAVLAPKLNLEFLFEETLEIFGENEMKNLLRTTKGFRGRNLLSLAAINKSKDSVEFLWKTFEENLSQEEIFKLLNEVDEEGDNILHLAARFVKSKSIFEFLWLKIKNYFLDEEKFRNYLKLKGFQGENILRLSTVGNLILKIGHQSQN